MTAEGWAALGLAIVNMIQVVLLAFLSNRQGRMAHNLNSHLTDLVDTQASDAELAARPGPPPIMGTQQWVDGSSD